MNSNALFAEGVAVFPGGGGDPASAYGETQIGLVKHQWAC